MASLVICHPLLLLRREHTVFLFKTSNHPLNCVYQVHNLDELLRATRSYQRPLVAHVGYISTREARGEGCKTLGNFVHIILQLESLEVNQEDVSATLDVGLVYSNLSVETPRAHQSLVKHVWSVCAYDRVSMEHTLQSSEGKWGLTCQDYHPTSSAESIHLY